MPTLNVRLAGIVFVVVVVLGGGVHLLHGFQVGRQAYALKAASKHAEDDKNQEEAMRLLDSYVRLAPNDHAAELHLGVMCAEAHNMRKASNLLEDGLRQVDASNIDEKDLREARRKAVDVALIFGRFSDAKSHLDILMDHAVDKNKERKAKGEPPQGDPELLELYGVVLRYSGNNQEACDVLRDAIAVDPHHINTYVLLATIMRAQLHQNVESNALIDSMLKNNGKSVDAYEKAVLYYLGQQDLDKAIAIANKALEVAPDDARVLSLQGRCYTAQKNYPKAAEFFKASIKADKKNPSTYLFLGQTLNNMNKPAEAVDILNDGLAENKDAKGRLEMVYMRAHALVDVGKFAEAQKDVRELREGVYAPEKADFVEARIALQQQEWPKAERLLRENVLPKATESFMRRAAWIYLAQCYHQKGAEKDQIAALQRALEIDPFNFQTRSSLADIYMSHQQLELAREQYAEAMKGSQSEAAMFNVLRISIMLQLRHDAEKRDWHDVDAMIDHLTQAKAFSTDLEVLKAEVLLAKDQSRNLSNEAEEADRRLRECTKKRPDSPDAWLALFKLDVHRASKESDPAEKAKLWNTASADIDAAEKHLGDRVAVRMARGTLAVHRDSKSPQTKELLKRLGENTDGFQEIEKTQIWGVLATLAVEAEDLDLARDYCRRIAAREPKNIRIRYLLCDLDLRAYEKGGTADVQELDRLKDEIERLGGQGPYWLYAKAIRALVQSKNKDQQLLAEARGDLDAAMKERPDWSALVVLSGKICELQDDPEDALNYYHTAIHFMNERDNDVIGRTVRLLLPRGRIVEAKELFDFLEKQKSPLLDEMKQQYIYVNVFRGEVAPAEREVDAFVPPGSKDYKDLIWQGEMYWYLTRRLKGMAQQKLTPNSEDWKKDSAMLMMAQKGLNALARARDLNPQDEDVYVGLVRLYHEVGQAQGARPLIDAAERTLKGDKALVTMGFCYELLNDLPKAQEKYEAAVKANPENPRILRQLAVFYVNHGQLAPADPLLRKMISLQDPAAVAYVFWARRTLAKLLDRGSFDDRCKAVELIDENLQGKMATTEDKRLKALYLKADPRREKLADAIAAMEELVKAPDATPDDNFELAQLYLKQHNDSAYEKQMSGVLASKQPRYLLAYINVLLDRKNFADAEQVLQTLEKIAPDSIETLRIRAEFLARRDDLKGAFDLAVAYLEKPQAQLSRGQQIYDVADIAENLATQAKKVGRQADAATFAAKAEELFLSLRSKKLSVGGDLVYAGFLARQNRFDEALDVLSQSLQSPHPEIFQLAAVAMIGSRAATPAQLAQLEKLLVAAAAKAEHPTNLRLLLAILHDQQGQYEKAQADCREVLVKEPRNYQALSTLSLSLARNGGNLDEALTLVNQAVAFSGPLPALLDARAVVYVARREPEKALEDITAAVGDTGLDGEAMHYFHQAWILSLLDRKADAAVAMTKARGKDLDPKQIVPQEISVYDRLKDVQ